MSCSKGADKTEVVYIAKLLDYAKPGSSFNGRTEKREILKCIHGAKIFMREQCKDVVVNTHPERCVVQSYSSDGTPALMNRRWTAQLHNTAYVRRGKQSDEMLVERCFFQG